MTDETRAFYDDLANDYHLVLADWDRSIAWQSDVLDRLIGEEIGGDRIAILDCACGIGTQAIGLALRGHRVHATDLSPNSVERARHEAARRGASLTFGVADLRTLPDHVDDTFDVVLAFDNALPHLLSEEDVQRAVAAMAGRLRRGGLLLASIRDYDRILAERPAGEVPRLLDNAAGRRIVFQLWDWAPDGLTYDLRLFLLRHQDEQWETQEHVTRYRALRRDELTAALDKAGLTEIRWLMPEESGYYQPIVTARKP
ncbi:MAG TPA: class I SAM-dependent methyltransferase [Thermomicrobiales bacterium]|nr:class I SAM-dependent methyltransferase [Thermomicrobiales bacterium]